MKTIHVHQVDAFASAIFGGNPAGVVSDADGLSDQQMIAIAREMNLSETAFVLQPSSGAADVRLRFFTPGAAEIDFCGHATVGTLFTLSRLELFGLGRQGKNDVRVETNAGILDMSVERSGSQPQSSFQAPAVQMEPYRLQGAAFATAFGIPAAALLTGDTILRDSMLNYVYIPLVSTDVLGKLAFDFAAIRQHFGPEKIVVFCLYASTGSKGSAADLQARGLAPLVGVDEDPFTGSMQSGLVHAAKQTGVLPASQRTIVTEQGQYIGRPGSATIEHDTAADTVTVFATAAHVFSTTVELA